MSLQEKFQITVPPNQNEDKGENEWVWPPKRTTGEAGFQHSNNTYADGDALTKTNYLPPGMELDNQARKRIEQMPLVMSGQSDISADTNAQAFANGFTRRNMKGTDDQYSGEHMDHFYGEAVGEDDTGERYSGFAERNNYLDRE